MTRIVSLLSSATEMLFLSGAGPRVVGISHECDYPPQVATLPRVTRSNINAAADSRAIDDQVKLLLEEGRPLYEIDIPRLVELAPDLIVTQSQCDVCAVRYEDVLDAIASEPRLRQTAVVSLNPSSLADVLVDLERVAAAAGVAELGVQAAAALQRRVDAVREKTSQFADGDRPRVALIEWTDPLMFAGNWMPELVEIVGGKYDLARPGVHSSYAAWDDLVGYNPEVIVVMPCGFELERSRQEGNLLAKQPGWHDLDAVKTGRVFAVDGSAYFNRPGPRLVDSLELLAHLLHPNLFSSIQSTSPAFCPC